MARIKNPITLVGAPGGGGEPAKPEETKSVALSMASGDQVITPTAGSVLTEVRIIKPATLKPENIKADVSIGGVTGSYTGSGAASMPTLRAVTISRSNSTTNTLTISNPSSNGTFVSGYKIYDNGELKATQSSASYNLYNLGIGTHSVTVKAYGSNFNDSPTSNTLVYGVYGITRNFTNISGSNTATYVGMGNGYTTTLTAASGYYLPNNVTVTIGGEPAKYTYDNDTGVLTIAATALTGDVVITAEGSLYSRLASTVALIAENILTWEAVENATRYSIRLRGIEVATTSELSYDLSTLFSEDGMYPMTVVAQADGYQESNPSPKVTYMIGVQPIYGVSGLYNSAPGLTRTDDAVGLSFAINSSTGAIASDFDDVFPWNRVQLETIDGNEFVTWPEMYFRIGTDSNKRITDVAVSATPGGEGNWHKVESFRIGRYGGYVTGGKLTSRRGVNRSGNYTRAQFRSYAAANGEGYSQLSLYHYTVLQFLWWIEWATKDSASIMTGRISGSGTSGGSTLRPCGGTDSVPTPSGFEPQYKQMRYHYIEDFVGNMLQFVDGYVGTSSAQYASADPATFTDSTSGMPRLGYNVPSTSGNCVAAFGWDDENPFLCYPIETVNNSSYNTYFCDYTEKGNYPVLYVGAYYYNANANCGVSFFNRNTASYSYSYYGARLENNPVRGV